MAERGKSEYSQSVSNALRLLGCFVEREERGISELSRELGLSKSAVARIVASLECGKFLLKNAETGKYRLGVGFLLYGSLVRERSELSRVLAPALSQLAEEFQATAHLAVLIGKELTIVNKVSAGSFVYMSSRVGGTLPMHASATGKCILAWLPAEQRAELLEECDFKRYTDSTITDKAALESELSVTRVRGYALDDGETHDGLYCIGCPVLDAAGDILAAVSVSGSRAVLESQLDAVVNSIRNSLKNIGI